jgi:hypothetical protein
MARMSIPILKFLNPLLEQRQDKPFITRAGDAEVERVFSVSTPAVRQ